MNIHRCDPYLKYGWGVLFVLGLIGSIPLPGMAQITPDDITPDDTLGNERSRVNRNVQIKGRNADRIEGGATRGSNLFHSFREFNVNEGQRVYFANPSGIENILSRVTGTDVSDIMGTLGVDGGANLFLLNPNGIMFGPNARLDVSGSFTASTGNGFTFPDGSVFSATNPGDSSLLSVSVPLGVQYGPGVRGDITNEGFLKVEPAQTLNLLGERIRLSNGGQVVGGQVVIARNINAENSPVQPSDLVEVTGGRIDIDAGTGKPRDITSSLSVTNQLEVNTRDLRITNGGEIKSSTSDQGNAGSIRINADSVEVSGTRSTINGSGNEVVVSSTLRTQVEPPATDNKGNPFRDQNGNVVRTTGRGGRLTINTGELRISNGGLVTASTFSQGNAGNIRINADSVVVRDLATGPQGNLVRNAARAPVSSILRTQVEPPATDNKGNPFRDQNGNVVRTTGRGGRLTINTGELRISNGGLVTASTFSQGNAGNIRINADSVDLSNNGRLSAESTTLPAQSTRIGRAGSINITTDQLNLQDASTITVNSDNGSAGNLTITTNSATLNNSTLDANAEAAGKNNANIELTVSGPLLRLEGTRPESLQRDEGTRPESQNERNQNALISANETGAANGGNVTLNVENGFVLANPNDNGDITANAYRSSSRPSGDGGQVKIDSNFIFGLERRDNPTNLSDITATSQSGDTGTITLNTLNINPTQGLVNFPIEPVNVADLVVSGCLGRNRSGVQNSSGVREQGEFTITGRGGLSPNPSEPLSGEPTGDDDLATVNPNETPSGSAAIPHAPTATTLVEAQGLARNASGKVSLVPNATTTTPNPPISNPEQCIP